MEKMILWEMNQEDYEGNPISYFIEADKIETGVYLADGNCRIWDTIPGKTEIAIPTPVIWEGEEYDNLHDMGTDSMIEYLDSLVGVKSRWAKEGYEPIDDCLGYDMDNRFFFDLNDCEQTKFYEYLSNTNYKTVVCGPDTTEYELEIVDSYTLDIWDGSNHYYPKGSTGNHATLKKVVIDGKEKGLLWHEWSQWQGSELDSGYLLTKEEALKELANHPEIEEIREWLQK